MNLTTLLPLIFRLLELYPQIKDALDAHTSITDLFKKFAPDLLLLVTDMGAQLFPALPATSQADAGALRLDIERVRDIQTKLNARGATLVVDGQYGPGTKAAVAVFQQAHGLTADGWAGPLTVVELEKPVAPAVSPVSPIPL